MDDGRPLARFQLVAKVIRTRISDGTYPVGSRLPSISGLGAEFDVSHMTVKQALNTLADEGVIASRRGVPAEVLAAPATEEPLSLAARLARVESALGALEKRVTAVEIHGSNLTQSEPPHHER
ncbi:putative GntR family transcriptional regulator [Microlunatus phosphovorus NM-1]|uniref:Putative GntR family transcriptional regulator n=1 Tax=Microlunatus phosphovorus (strain ATCC 700054 / DSM 10555 / JCM 9379 / NBRC 101784 / NCIMB 13414 / VKM Ac-1990 / NM-1) TaxID=1032480 RepID=F5XL68_MICPN|nr:GntR family transcriptional regulator [Microlunatus phosphovorus]BAK33756.1 putative GntR family transcriptional regulator [Microlunatus phosphovorus NM-1]